ncbi:MAG: hypothetical protein RQ745_10205 [Longimicrobiales bacterium]|nr:hypothetical protein [Longimicrobiales bacterium]
MAKQLLDDSQVRAAFEQVGREAVSEGVRCDVLPNAGDPGGAYDHLLHGSRGEVPVSPGAGKQPPIGLVRILVEAKRFHGPVGQQRVAILGSLPTPDPQKASLDIDIFRSEAHEFADPESRRVEEQQERAMLEVPRDRQQPCDFRLGEDGGEPGLLLRAGLCGSRSSLAADQAT